jgi:hypothetical protein
MRLHLSGPVPNDIRYKVDPRLVPPQKAARYLHLTLHQFQDALPSLIARGFPRACPVIGHFDLAAINHWLDLQSGVERPSPEADAVDLEKTILERIARYRNAERRAGSQRLRQ